jgi:tetratricopeptide (TPR) repeat protein
MSWSKPLAAIAVAVVAGLTLYRFVWLPLQCNYVEGRLRGTTEAVLDEPPMRQHIRARANLAEIERLPLHCRRGAETQMVIAANYRILGRYDDAIAAYISALDVEKRPEIYLQLGLTQIQDGRTGEAIRNLATAVRFHPPLINEIPEGIRASVSVASAPY